MLARQRNGELSAREQLRASRKEYVKTEALMNATLAPGAPRLFPSPDDDEADFSEAVPSFASLSPVLERKASERRNEDMITFCVTSTPNERPVRRMPLTVNRCAPHIENRAQLYSQSTTPPPRPPKPQWMRKKKLVTTDDHIKNISCENAKPIPAPRWSKLRTMQENSSNVIQGVQLSLTSDVKSCEALRIANERAGSRVRFTNAQNSLQTHTLENDVGKASGGLSVSVSGSPGRIHPPCLHIQSAPTSSHECAYGDFVQILSSPDSDSGLHRSSFDSLEQSLPNGADKGVTSESNSTGNQLPLASVDSSAGACSEEIQGLGKPSEEKPLIAGSCMKRDCSFCSKDSSDVSMFTSVTANNASSLTDSEEDDCCKGRNAARSPLEQLAGGDLSLIERNARVIKWIYGCRMTAK